ncbi:MAG: efflux RND transporter periplasmic adaptor subunit [Bryobacteraceae bacterium]
MKRYWLVAVGLVLLLAWWAFAHQQAVPEVHFAKVTQAGIESTISTNGKVDPFDWAAARAESPGVVRAISIQRGATVQAGQTLVTLDTTAAEAELAATEARAQEARAELSVLSQGGRASQLSSLASSITAAEASIEVAQRNYASLQRLQRSQAATSLQVQEAKDALDRARQQLSAFQAQRQTLVTSGDKAVAQAKLRDAEAAVVAAKHRLSLGVIRSPMNGTVYQFDLKVGAYLQAGDLVALVGNLDRLKVTVYVDEPDLGRLSEHLPVEITWDARPGQKWTGKIDKLPTQVVALGTRTVGEVTTVIENPQHDLLPGVSVNAKITTSVAGEALTIPKAALRTLRGTTGVFRLSNKTLAWTPVKPGISDVNNVQIVSGLHQGDEVADRVVNPSDAELLDGIKVKPNLD